MARMAHTIVGWMMVCTAAFAADQPANPVEAPSSPPSRNISGDTITLRSGKTLSGLQVLRKTSTVLEVEVVQGTEPLEIPMSLVEKVEFDDYDLLAVRRREARERDHNAQTMPGQKIPQELMAALTRRIDVPRQDGPEDLLKILEKLSALAGVSIKVAPEVQKLPIDQRLWDLPPSKETTLLTIFSTTFARRFTNLSMHYEEDAVRIVATVPAGE